MPRIDHPMAMALKERAEKTSEACIQVSSILLIKAVYLVGAAVVDSLQDVAREIRNTRHEG